MREFVVHTDGGSRGNPGPSAIGMVIADGGGKTVKEYHQFLGTGTNNAAEYAAVIFALKKLKALVGKENVKAASVQFYLDSELVVKQLNGIYKLEDPQVQKNFIEIWNLKIGFGKVTFTHIPREQNKRADALVNVALDAAAGGGLV